MTVVRSQVAQMACDEVSLELRVGLAAAFVAGHWPVAGIGLVDLSGRLVQRPMPDLTLVINNEKVVADGDGEAVLQSAMQRERVVTLAKRRQ